MSRGVLDAAEQAAVRALVAEVTAHDGLSPLNEQAALALDGPGEVTRHHLAPSGDDVAGYAQADLRTGTGQLLVHPAQRRRGHGTRLLQALLDDGCTGVWAFGDLPEARAFAARHRLPAGRRLLIMERALPAGPAPALPRGITLRAFEPDRDAAAFLAVNAAAFAGHPEQGRFSRADLAARMAEPWFDAAGLIVAEDARGLAGFHWTKRHDAATGEVYVLGVHPRAQGSGLGRALLGAGLAALAALGCTRVLLYVDRAEARTVQLYERAGFAAVHADVLYDCDRPLGTGARP